jgi:hypothetical protein
LRFACNLAGRALGRVAVVGSMLIEGFGLAGAGEVGESAGRPVTDSAICATRVVSVSTVGTVRRHSPTKPRPMIPAINPIALRRCRVARPTLKEGSDRICPGCGELDCVLSSLLDAW